MQSMCNRNSLIRTYMQGWPLRMSSAINLTLEETNYAIVLKSSHLVKLSLIRSNPRILIAQAIQMKSPQP